MRENRIFANANAKTQISFAVTVKLISAFVIATQIEQSLFFLNPKFQASSHVLWMYSPVCVGPGRKPRRPVFLTTRLIYNWLVSDLVGNAEDRFSCDLAHLISNFRSFTVVAF